MDRFRCVVRSGPAAYCPPGRVSSVGLSWHTSSVGVPGYSMYCLPGSRVQCAAIYPNEDEISHYQNPVCTPVPGGQSHHKYPTCAPVPGGHYQIVTGGNALGNRQPSINAAWRAVRQRLGLYRTATCKEKCFFFCLSPCDGCKDPKG